jgi:hypothetical protein
MLLRESQPNLKKVSTANTIPNFLPCDTLGTNLYQAFDILSINRIEQHIMNLCKIMNDMKIVKQARLEYLTGKERLKKTYIVC